MKISELKPMIHRVRFHSDDVVGGYVSKGFHEATVVEVLPVGIHHGRIKTPGNWHRLHSVEYQYDLVEDEPENELENMPLPIPCRQTLVNKRSID